MPERAWISLPMITFSFRPSSESDRAWIAASVSTRVVSWKEAADSHDSVASDAFVMPMRVGGPAAGGTPRLNDGAVDFLELRPLDQLAGQQLGVAGLDHVHPLEHLADDDLDVLVVDRHALRPVDLLDLVDQVQLHLARAEDAEHLVRVDRTGNQLLADLDVVAVAHQRPGPDGHLVGDLVRAVVWRDDDPPRLVLLVDPDAALHLADRRQALGNPGLEQLLD